MNYYNEFDAGAAAWLRELIKEGLIPDGFVDTRSIVDVQPEDVREYTQCHFFAGIAGWPLALQLAGWPDDRPVWTGSCPCQPFSAAGKRKGTADERHLWPEFARLIRECRPATVFGEQVEGAVRLGWLDGVFADLEGAGYACGAAVLGSHSVGSPHIRQRLFWVADAEGAGSSCTRAYGNIGADADGTTCRLADAELQRAGPGDGQERASGQRGHRPAIDGDAVRLEHAQGDGWNQGRAEPGGRGTAGGCGPGGMGDASGTGLAGWQGERCDDGSQRETAERAGSFWAQYDLIACRDGKLRRVPAGAQSVFLGLADGVSDDLDSVRRAGFPLCEAFPGRAPLLKGFGNAINAYQAAAFIKAYMVTI